MAAKPPKFFFRICICKSADLFSEVYWVLGVATAPPNLKQNLNLFPMGLNFFLAPSPSTSH